MVEARGQPQPAQSSVRRCRGTGRDGETIQEMVLAPSPQEALIELNESHPIKMDEPLSILRALEFSIQ